MGFALLCAVLAAGPAGAAAPSQEEAEALAGESLRQPLTRENFYFVMADRFANGSAANDEGGLSGGKFVTGYDPTAKGFYHGGDLQGLTGKLNYIKGLGTTSIWMTPSFKNKPVQGTVAEDGTDNRSAAYHGYWITDFTQIDPHLGSNQDLSDLIDAAHRRGMKVFFDIITNHTADVIDYRAKEGGPQPYAYVSKAASPFRDASGTPFDDRDVAGQAGFPALDAATSFPFTPFLRPGEEDVKRPAWLNDTTLYHNRGDSTFSGENSLYGDFFGLDDLFTENPRVVDGMIDIYKGWVRDFGIDGFRIDTVKHVNLEFWQKFAPAVLEEAHRVGKREFFMFGEVFDTSRPFTSSFTTQAKLQAILDFPFQAAAQGFAAGSKPTDGLRELFEGDDYYTDADSNAYQLPTFLGNHDMGRIGRFVATDPNNAGASEFEQFQRVQLAHALMYFARGNPVVYYGDEQGFTGDGGDQLARQDMFPSRVDVYNDDNLIGTRSTTARANFAPSHPLYRAIGRLATVARWHPALRDGAQQHRVSGDAPGVYAFSRIDRDAQVEYLVALNNSERPATATVPTYSAGKRFTRVYGRGRPVVRSDASQEVELTVPALGAIVYRAVGRADRSAAAPDVAVELPDAVRDRVEVTAAVESDSFNEVTFAVRAGGADEWAVLGTDDNAPYRVFHDASALAPGTPVEYLAVVRDNAGHVSRAVASAEVAPPREPVTRAIVHYQRPAGDYADWGLHLFGDGLAAGAGTEWTAPLQRTGTDAFGARYEVPVGDDTKSVGFIVHTPGGDSVPTTREPGGDRFFIPAEHPEIWLRQGDERVYFEAP